MFTGIVEETGSVEKIQRGTKSILLTVRAKTSARGLKTGGSLAVNGCCLTAAKISSRGRFKLIQFDLLAETWNRTNFQFLKTGSLVNLERPLRAGGEFGGHFVTGHIDGAGKILRWEKSGADHVLEISAPENVMRYVIEKGSIAIDGISLTVAGVGQKKFLRLDHPAHVESHCVARAKNRRRGESGGRSAWKICGQVSWSG